MNRTAIVLDKHLEPGAAANTAAVLMGHLSLRCSCLYDPAGVTDQAGRIHAGIRNNVAILKAGPGQLLNLCERIGDEYSEVDYVVFSTIGRSLSNSYPEYVQRVSTAAKEETSLVGVALTGDEVSVKALTRKFSVY